MCGIYGITENNKDLVNLMISKCSHRGPDGSNIFASDILTLGHNLLSITSNPNDGKQPWITEKGNVIVYNGEIFNYEDLVKRFKNNFIPKTTCDTELLSWLFDNFSYEKVISELIDSMHAIVLYNKSSNELILSRDHAGIKPLYFSFVNKGLIFCSEIKGLLDHVKQSNKIDRLALACTSLLGVNVLRQTIFKSIFKVLPGETIIYDLNNYKIKRTFRTLVKPLSNNILNIDEFKYITSQTIKNSTLGTRKFGIFLSGGVDSSIIAFELNKYLDKINSFTNIMDPNAIIDGEDYNSDANVARRYSNELNLNHSEVIITPETFTDYWDDSIKFMEEPRYNWNLPMYYFTNKFLSKNNIVVTMSGDMGDELFGGYPHYFRMKNIAEKPKNWSDFIRLWMRKFAAPIHLNVKFNYNDLHDILLKTLPEEIWNADDIVNSAMALDSVTTVSEDFFTRNDKFGMAFSMEGRFPLASKNYMQYCLSIKSEYKIGKSLKETKLPVKLSYNTTIPKYIFNKNKTGWSVPITSWLQENDIIKDKYFKILKKDDGIREILSEENYLENPKRIIIACLLRSWSQHYNMSI